MKVNSTIYKGIEYVQVRELPPDQRELLLQSINRELLIKIMIEGKLVRNCLLFKDYEIWFDSVYQVKKDSAKPRAETPGESQDPTAAEVKAVKKI